MRRASFAEMEHDGKKLRTRREEFLEKIDASIMVAPSSTKNLKRDPEMHQTKKGKQ